MPSSVGSADINCAKVTPHNKGPVLLFSSCPNKSPSPDPLQNPQYQEGQDQAYIMSAITTFGGCSPMGAPLPCFLFLAIDFHVVSAFVA